MWKVNVVWDLRNDPGDSGPFSTGVEGGGWGGAWCEVTGMTASDVNVDGRVPRS